MPTAAFSPDLTHDDALAHRPRLLGRAYRMLGDVAEAEDVVQEGYLRWLEMAPPQRAAIRAPEGWFVTVVTRIALDRLRRARTARVAYTGPWLPEPVAVLPSDGPPPDHAAELASDLSLALLVLLERLAPEERAAFLLREVFDSDYDDIARILGKRPEAVRKAVHRARRRVREERPRIASSPEARERVLGEFVTALGDDDPERLLALLAPDVVLTSDSGGRVGAARRPVLGALRVSRFLFGVRRKFGADWTHRPGMLNGEPALLTFSDGTLHTVTFIATDGARVTSVYSVRNPDKLRHALTSPIALR